MEPEARHTDGVAGRDPLAVRLAYGDPSASRDLVERYHAGLYRYAVAILLDSDAAEDAVQDVFERALSAFGRYSEERLGGMMLRPWLYRITLNVVRNRLRRQREMPVGEDPSTLLGNSTDGLAERREDAMDALAALAYLPEKQRVAVTLRYLQDLPYAEIARITGWPESTAKTLVRRGLIRLRDLLILEDSEDGDAR